MVIYLHKTVIYMAHGAPIVLTTIWLPHAQLWAIIEEDSLTHSMLPTAF